MAKSPKIPKDEAEKRQWARERKRLAQERKDGSSAEAADFHPPQNFCIDLPPLLINGVDTGVYEPLFVPHIALKDTQGRYQPRKFVVRLREALAVHTLIAYHSLTVILGTTTAAENELVRGKLPVLPKRLLTEGRKFLSEWTMYRSEDELRVYSKRKFSMLKAAGAELPGDFRSKKVAAEMSAVNLMSMTYQRAAIVLPAYEKVQKAIEKKLAQLKKRRPAQEDGAILIDPALHAELQAAYDRYESDAHVDTLWEIAVYGDLNPVVLWPQHINSCTELMEIGRVVGRIDRGIDARLTDAPRALLTRILRNEYGPHGDNRDEFATRIRQNFGFHYDLQNLLEVLDAAMKHGGDLVVSRGTRALNVEGPRPAIREEKHRWFDALTAMIQRFMPRGRAGAE